jgi:hypothetical protein
MHGLIETRMRRVRQNTLLGPRGAAAKGVAVRDAGRGRIGLVERLNAYNVCNQNGQLEWYN